GHRWLRRFNQTETRPSQSLKSVPPGEPRSGMLPGRPGCVPVAVNGTILQVIMTEADIDEAERHRAKMAKRKQGQDAEEASKTIQKGLLMVNTGPGKGKSTAAFGLALRALGHGWRIGVVQFIKGRVTGEQTALGSFGDRGVWHTAGEG